MCARRVMHIMSSREASSRDRLCAISRCIIIVSVAMAEGWPDFHMALAQDGAPQSMSLPQPPYSGDRQGAYETLHPTRGTVHQIATAHRCFRTLKKSGTWRSTESSVSE